MTNICINNLLSKLRECYQQGLLYLSAAAMSSEQAIFNSVPVSTLHILLSWAPTNLRGYQYCILCMSSCVLFEGQEGPPEQPISEEYLYPYSVVKADERLPALSLVVYEQLRLVRRPAGSPRATNIRQSPSLNTTLSPVFPQLTHNPHVRVLTISCALDF